MDLKKIEDLTVGEVKAMDVEHSKNRDFKRPQEILDEIEQERVEASKMSPEQLKTRKMMSFRDALDKYPILKDESKFK